MLITVYANLSVYRVSDDCVPQHPVGGGAAASSSPAGAIQFAPWRGAACARTSRSAEDGTSLAGIVARQRPLLTAPPAWCSCTDARHNRRLPPAAKHHPAHHIHLPQLHRTERSPPLGVRLATLPSLRVDQTMTNQTSVDRRSARQIRLTITAALVQDPSRTATRMSAAKLRYPGLDHRRHLVRTRLKLGGLVDQPFGRVVLNPRVNGLTHLPQFQSRWPESRRRETPETSKADPDGSALAS